MGSRHCQLTIGGCHDTTRRLKKNMSHIWVILSTYVYRFLCSDNRQTPGIDTRHLVEILVTNFLRPRFMRGLLTPCEKRRDFHASLEILCAGNRAKILSQREKKRGIIDARDASREVSLSFHDECRSRSRWKVQRPDLFNL